VSRLEKHARVRTSRVCRQQDQPLYPFGHGLSYTSFAYSDLAVSLRSGNSSVSPSVQPRNEALSFTAGDEVIVHVNITNTGAVSGSHAVLLLVGDDFCIVPPTPPMVRGFQKVELAPGQSQTLVFEVRVDFSGMLNILHLLGIVFWMQCQHTGTFMDLPAELTVMCHADAPVRVLRGFVTVGPIVRRQALASSRQVLGMLDPFESMSAADPRAGHRQAKEPCRTPACLPLKNKMDVGWSWEHTHG
jgi:hypothetical protein